MYGRRLNYLFYQDESVEEGFQKYEILASCGDGTCLISGTYAKFGLAAQREMLVFDHHHLKHMGVFVYTLAHVAWLRIAEYLYTRVTGISTLAHPCVDEPKTTLSVLLVQKPRIILIKKFHRE